VHPTRLSVECGIPVTFAQVHIDTTLSWRLTVAAYVTLSAVFLIASPLDRAPASAVWLLSAVFGPVTWLIWGVPLYFLATITFALSVLGAVTMQGRSTAPRSGRYWLLPAVVWLALGAWAVLFTV